MWRFSQTNPPGCKSAKILLLLPGRRASHGDPLPDAQAPQSISLSYCRKQSYDWEDSSEMSGLCLLNTNAVFSEVALLPKQPDSAANRKSQKENPTQTQVYGYSSTGLQLYLQRNSSSEQTAHLWEFKHDNLEIKVSSIASIWKKTQKYPVPHSSNTERTCFRIKQIYLII